MPGRSVVLKSLRWTPDSKYGYAKIYERKDRRARWYNPAVSETSWRQTLAKTQKMAFGRIAQILGSSELTEEYWEDLHAALIQADVGLDFSGRLIDELHKAVREHGLTQGNQVSEVLGDYLISSLGQPPHLPTAAGPVVTLLVGVNGSGKTTSAAKLARWHQARGLSVLLAAADTYRAAASDQLRIWGDRLGINVIAGIAGSDPGAVVYDACGSAIAQHIDHLIIDTSGRMHTEHNLMDELGKISRVSAKAIDGAPHLTLLVLDATTGQNGLAQARAFLDAVKLDGTILAKLDGSAKGGIALAVKDALGVPVVYAGTGETLDDLKLFDPSAYVRGLLGEHEGGSPRPI